MTVLSVEVLHFFEACIASFDELARYMSYTLLILQFLILSR